MVDFTLTFDRRYSSSLAVPTGFMKVPLGPIEIPLQKHSLRRREIDIRLGRHIFKKTQQTTYSAVVLAGDSYNGI